jgi:cell division septation protein DedD
MARTPSPRAEAARRGTRPTPGPATGREPWLEEADLEPEPSHTLVGRRTLWGLVIGLALLVALVAAGLLLLTRKADSPIDIPDGEVPLVASPGPWKVPAQGVAAEGVPVEGQGQILFPAGEGMDPDAAIDPSRLPEEPVPPVPASGEAPVDLLPPTVEEVAPPPAAPVATAPRPASPAPTPAGQAPAAAMPAGVPGTVQLGAFSSEAAARAAWKGMAARFSYLAGFTPVIQPVERNAQTLYRLRASGPEAADICNRLRVAGEECALVR